VNKRTLTIVVVTLLLAGFVSLAFKAVSLISCRNRPGSAAGNIDKENGELLLERAKKFTDAGELVKAKAACLKIMEKYPASVDIQKVQEMIGDINIRVLFSPVITKDSFQYAVEKGDTLTKIAKQFGTTKDLIYRATGLKSEFLRIGQKLKVTKMKFDMVVDKSQNLLTLRNGQDIVKMYRVATGKNNSSPVGTFTIINKIIDPPWYPPTGGVVPPGDPKNVLGSRWLGLSKPSYGIHGTTEPDSIGKNVTEGCVRLKNSEVEELYTIVPEGTEVVIVD
jgi:lipoprotein-anchoring transpeptidase ErfK/SrfK